MIKIFRMIINFFSVKNENEEENKNEVNLETDFAFEPFIEPPTSPNNEVVDKIEIEPEIKLQNIEKNNITAFFEVEDFENNLVFINRFPNFKINILNNSGEATRLEKMSIHISQFEYLLNKPDVVFSVDMSDQRLVVYAENIGWTDIIGYTFTIKDKLLTSLFPEDVSIQKDIYVDEKVVLMEFSIEKLSSDTLKKVLRKARNVL